VEWFEIEVGNVTDCFKSRGWWMECGWQELLQQVGCCELVVLKG